MKKFMLLAALCLCLTPEPAHAQVNGVTCSNGITCGLAAGTATFGLSTIPSHYMTANITGGNAAPTGVPLQVYLDTVFGTLPGTILQRNASTWTALAAGPVGTYLVSNGAGQPVAWSSQLYPWGLPTQATNTVLGNVTGGNASPTPITATQLLNTIDYDINRPPVPGAMLYKDTANTWRALSWGPPGWVMTANGQTNRPDWAPPSVGLCPPITNSNSDYNTNPVMCNTSNNAGVWNLMTSVSSNPQVFGGDFQLGGVVRPAGETFTVNINGTLGGCPTSFSYTAAPGQTVADVAEAIGGVRGLINSNACWTAASSFAQHNIVGSTHFINLTVNWQWLPLTRSCSSTGTMTCVLTPTPNNVAGGGNRDSEPSITLSFEMGARVNQIGDLCGSFVASQVSFFCEYLGGGVYRGGINASDIKLNANGGSTTLAGAGVISAQMPLIFEPTGTLNIGLGAPGKNPANVFADDKLYANCAVVCTEVAGGAGTVTNAAALTASHIVLGDAGNAITVLGSLGTGSTVLHGNAGGAPSFGAVISADLNITTTACSNQFVTAISAGAVGTCTVALLAGPQFANQGNTTQLLHGNNAGNPSFGAVVSADLNITPTSCTNQFVSGVSAAAAVACTSFSLSSAQFANQGAVTTVLHGNNAGNPSFGPIVSADLNITTTSCVNQFVRDIGASGTGACATVTLAGPQFATQGTTTTVLHGNAAGNPSFGAVANGDLATMAANTIKGNQTGSTATPTDLTACQVLSITKDPLRAGGRLTLTSGTPVTTADVTNAGTVFYDVYVDDKIAVYDGTNWCYYTFTVQPLILNAADNTANSLYDVFAVAVAGIVGICTGPAWTNPTTRSAVIARFNGVWTNNASLTCKNNGLTFATAAANTARYIGTVGITGTNAKTEDSVLNRFVFNADNRVQRMLVAKETTNWSYTTFAWRAWNNSTANRVTVITGLDENPLNISASEYLISSVGNNFGMTLDGTGAPSSTCNSVGGFVNSPTAANYVQVTSTFLCYTGIGSHFVQIVEIGAGSGTNTTYGSDPQTNIGLGARGFSIQHHAESSELLNANDNWPLAEFREAM